MAENLVVLPTDDVELENKDEEVQEHVTGGNLRNDTEILYLFDEVVPEKTLIETKILGKL